MENIRARNTVGTLCNAAVRVCVKWNKRLNGRNVWPRGFYASANESVKAFFGTRSDDKLYAPRRRRVQLPRQICQR